MSTPHSHALAFDQDPYSVANFVDRMHGECAELQWLRELVVNSVEAIAATGERGKILVHSIEQDMGEGLENTRKLAVTDTGEGIAANQLYSSFQVAMTSRGRGNFGIGAKISSLPLNPAGMIYRSLVEGAEPAELIWHRTAMHGYYAAREWTDERTGETQFVTSPSCDPETFSRIADAGHGTQVVLCGKDPEDDTCRTLNPRGTKNAGNLHWAVRQLNFKFWKIPSNIEIRVENAKPDGRDAGQVRDYIVRGGEHAMKSFAAAQGVVELVENPYRVKWYLIKKQVAQKRNSQNGWGEGRIVATLYREKTGVVEVYAMRRTQRGGALMNDFGIYSGAERVVLVVEPTRQDLMQPTTARNDLRVGDEGNVTHAYKEIGAEFASLMPDEAPRLADYVKEQLEGLKSTSDEQSLKDVIAKAIELYKIEDYRRLAKGRVRTSESGLEGQPSPGRQETTRPDPVPDAEPDSDPEGPPPEPPVRPRPRPRPRPRLHTDPASMNKGTPMPPDITPKKFTWGPIGQDNVTNYTTNTQRAVTVNTDGETYNRLLALYKSRPDFAAYPQVVEDAVRRKCESSLQLSIFTLEREFETRRARLGLDFEAFFNQRGAGRVCLDAMASRDTHNALVREIKNLVGKAKAKEATESRAQEVALASA